MTTIIKVNDIEISVSVPKLSGREFKDIACEQGVEIGVDSVLSAISKKDGARQTIDDEDFVIAEWEKCEVVTHESKSGTTKDRPDDKPTPRIIAPTQGSFNPHRQSHGSLIDLITPTKNLPGVLKNGEYQPKEWKSALQKILFKAEYDSATGLFLSKSIKLDKK